MDGTVVVEVSILHNTVVNNLTLDNLLFDALLTEFFLNTGVKTRVIVVPCDYSRDIKNHFIETTVGFDTYCRTVSQLIGNICTDSRSAAKYYHFIRLLGRSPSHLSLIHI